MPENLKNVLLFMASSGYLVPPSENPAREKLWTETWKRIERFLPDLRDELKSELPLEEPAKAAVEAPAPAPQPQDVVGAERDLTVEQVLAEAAYVA